MRIVLWPAVVSLLYGAVCLVLNACRVLAGPYFFLQIHDFISEGRDLDIVAVEQAAVDIRECCQHRIIVGKIRVAVFWLLVQYAEQIPQTLRNCK